MYKGALFFLFCALSIVLSKHLVGKRPSRPTEKRYCGEVLNDALGLLCNNNYYGVQNGQKRAYLEDEGDEEQEPMPPVWSPEYFPLQTRHSVFGSMLRHRRSEERYGGIVDECCRRKGCTMDELRSYCAEV